MTRHAFLVIMLLVLLLASCVSLPPARTLQPDDLRRLAGTWHGYRRHLNGAQETLHVTITEDGRFIAYIDRFDRGREYRGQLKIQEGAVRLETPNTAGTLTLHEGNRKRVLTGLVTGEEAAQTSLSLSWNRRISYQLYLVEANLEPARARGGWHAIAVEAAGPERYVGGPYEYEDSCRAAQAVLGQTANGVRILCVPGGLQKWQLVLVRPPASFKSAHWQFTSEEHCGSAARVSFPGHPFKCERLE